MLIKLLYFFIGVSLFYCSSCSKKASNTSFLREYAFDFIDPNKPTAKGLFINIHRIEFIDTLVVSATIGNTTDIPISLAADENGKCITIVEVILNSGKIKRNIDGIKFPINSIILKKNSSMKLEGNLKISSEDINAAKSVTIKVLDVVEANENL